VVNTGSSRSAVARGSAAPSTRSVTLPLCELRPRRTAGSLPRMLRAGPRPVGDPSRSPWPLDALPDVPTRYFCTPRGPVLPAPVPAPWSRRQAAHRFRTRRRHHCGPLRRPKELADRWPLRVLVLKGSDTGHLPGFPRTPHHPRTHYVRDPHSQDSSTTYSTRDDHGDLRVFLPSCRERPPPHAMSDLLVEARRPARPPRRERPDRGRRLGGRRASV